MPNYTRLVQLAEHLEHGKLGHEVFDFSVYNNVQYARCGSAGCAIGECPILWPDAWMFGSYGYPVLKQTKVQYMEAVVDDICKWFDIYESHAYGLFLPDDVKAWNDFELTEDATKEQVARGIRNYIAYMRQEEERMMEENAPLREA